MLERLREAVIRTIVRAEKRLPADVNDVWGDEE